MRVVALDGFRLALRKENVAGPAAPVSAVVGGRVLGDIAKILADTEEPVSLCFTKSHVRMNIGQTRVVARLLEGEFIRYRQILPEEWQTRVTVERAELGSAIDRASLIAREGKIEPGLLQARRRNAGGHAPTRRRATWRKRCRSSPRARI